jgi:hypothetical protein
MSELELSQCPRCHSTNRDRGHLRPNWGWGWALFHRVWFRSNQAGFVELSKAVAAVACLDCGHIELSLATLPLKEVSRSGNIDDLLKRR